MRSTTPKWRLCMRPRNKRLPDVHKHWRVTAHPLSLRTPLTAAFPFAHERCEEILEAPPTVSRLLKTPSIFYVILALPFPKPPLQSGRFTCCHVNPFPPVCYSQWLLPHQGLLTQGSSQRRELSTTMGCFPIQQISPRTHWQHRTMPNSLSTDRISHPRRFWISM